MRGEDGAGGSLVVGGAGVPELEWMLEEAATDLERTIAECEALNASRPHRVYTRCGALVRRRERLYNVL